jgi:hypothetical protein
VLFEFDSKGRVSSISYLDHWGKLQNDRHNVAKLVFTRDEDGRVMKEKVYNKNMGRLGRYETHYRYESNGDQLKIEKTNYNVGTDRETPVEDARGVARYSCTFDQNHNLVRVEYYNDAMNLDENSETGVAVAVLKYDDAGNLTEEDFFGKDQKPKDHKVLKASVVKFKYDAAGQLVEEDFCDDKGKLKKGSGGVSILKRVFNEKERGFEFSSLDAKSKLAKNSNLIGKIAKISLSFDENANLSESRFYKSNGQMFKFKYAPVNKYKYDDQNNLVEVAFYDRNNHIARIRKTDASYFRFGYNNQGGLAEVSFYDKNDKPINRKDMKIAGMQMQRDLQGYIIDLKYFDKNRKEKSYRSDIYKPAAEIEFMNDGRGLLIKGIYRDKFGEESLGQLLF